MKQLAKEANERSSPSHPQISVMYYDEIIDQVLRSNKSQDLLTAINTNTNFSSITVTQIFLCIFAIYCENNNSLAIKYHDGCHISTEKVLP